MSQDFSADGQSAAESLGQVFRNIQNTKPLQIFNGISLLACNRLILEIMPTRAGAAFCPKTHSLRTPKGGYTKMIDPFRHLQITIKSFDC